MAVDKRHCRGATDIGGTSYPYILHRRCDGDKLMNYYTVTPKQATCEEMKMEDVIETAIAFKKALMAVIENSTDLDLINWAECQEDDITNVIQQGKEYADITVERRQAIEERLSK